MHSSVARGSGKESPGFSHGESVNKLIAVVCSRPHGTWLANLAKGRCARCRRAYWWSFTMRLKDAYCPSCKGKLTATTWHLRSVPWYELKREPPRASAAVGAKFPRTFPPELATNIQEEETALRFQSFSDGPGPKRYPREEQVEQF